MLAKKALSRGQPLAQVAIDAGFLRSKPLHKRILSLDGLSAELVRQVCSLVKILKRRVAGRRVSRKVYSE